MPPSETDVSPNSISPVPAGAPPALSRIGATTGMLLVTANMIGTGIFMSGEILQKVESGPLVLLAWLIGGLAALCGALAYAELGAALPHNGGEFQFLGRALHPSIGFMSGFVSVFVGFSAPLAISSQMFGSLLHGIVPQCDPLVSGLLLLAVCAAVHIAHVEFGHWFQNFSTIIKIGLIVVFIVAGAGFCRWGYLTGGGQAPVMEVLKSPGFAVRFAVGLTAVTYAYSGWNAASYLAGEFRNPRRDIPLALLGGTTLVAVLYIALTAVFLASAPIKTLQVEAIASAAAVGLFGPSGGTAMTVLIILGLIPQAGSFLVTGSRVSEAIGRKLPALGWLAIHTPRGGAVIAILVQTFVAAGLMIGAKYVPQDRLGPALWLMIYTGLTLTFFSMLAVISLFVLRFREPNLPRPYRTWGYPVTPVVFLMLQAWMLFYGIQGTPRAALVSGATLLLAFAVWCVTAWSSRPSSVPRRSPS